MHKNYLVYPLFLLLVISCAANKSNIINFSKLGFTPVARTPVKILFEFSHKKHTVGYDVIPKTLNRPGISDFNDILTESISEISNIQSYRIYTHFSGDVKNPEKRKILRSLKDSCDYTIKIDIVRQKSFAKHFLGSLISIFSLTIIPVGYSWDYRFTVEVYDSKQKIFETYRSASITNWIEPLLIFIYPFHPEERKTEEIYYDVLINIFQEIENKGIVA